MKVHNRHLFLLQILFFLGLSACFSSEDESQVKFQSSTTSLIQAMFPRVLKEDVYLARSPEDQPSKSDNCMLVAGSGIYTDNLFSTESKVNIVSKPDYVSNPIAGCGTWIDRAAIQEEDINDVLTRAVPKHNSLLKRSDNLYVNRTTVYSDNNTNTQLSKEECPLEILHLKVEKVGGKRIKVNFNEYCDGWIELESGQNFYWLQNKQ